MKPRTVVMCPPTYFGIEYEINPWMSKERQPDRDLAWDQWLELRNVFACLGLRPKIVQPVRGHPDMVFTANAGVAAGNEFILSKFRHEERRGETPHFGKFFESLGYRVKDISRYLGPKDFFEGYGDLLPWGNGWVGAVGPRTTDIGLNVASMLMGIDPIVVKLIDERFYHSDTAFCPGGKWALYNPYAFDQISRERLRLHPFTYAVSEEDAAGFACNGVQIEISEQRYYITPPVSPELRKFMEKEGYEVIETPMSEFIKAGGATRCLSLFLL